MAALQVEQQQGQAAEIKTTKGKKLQSGQDYEFPEHEKHLVHVELESPQFDQSTGAKTSKPFIQKFYPQEFNAMDGAGNFAHMKVKFLHTPEGFISAKEKKEVEQGNQLKELNPLVRSEREKGIKLLSILDAKDEKQLREAHKALYPDVENPEQLDASEIKDDIVARVGEWSSETKEDLKLQYFNKLKGLGLVS